MGWSGLEGLDLILRGQADTTVVEECEAFSHQVNARQFDAGWDTLP